MNLIIQSIQNRLLLQHQNKFQHGFIPLIMSNLKNICFNIFFTFFCLDTKETKNQGRNDYSLPTLSGQAVPAE